MELIRQIAALLYVHNPMKSEQSANWIVPTNQSNAVFGLSNQSDYWISNKELGLFVK
jgi:hypothetical protein